MRLRISSIMPVRVSFEIEFDKITLRPCTVEEAAFSNNKHIYLVIDGSVYRLIALPGKCVFVNMVTMNRKDEGDADVRAYLSRYADFIYSSN